MTTTTAKPTVGVSVRVSADLHDRFMRIASKRGLSKSAAVLQAIQAWCEKKEEGK